MWFITISGRYRRAARDEELTDTHVRDGTVKERAFVSDLDTGILLPYWWDGPVYGTTGALPQTPDPAYPEGGSASADHA